MLLDDGVRAGRIHEGQAFEERGRVKALGNEIPFSVAFRPLAVAQYGNPVGRRYGAFLHNNLAEDGVNNRRLPRVELPNNDHQEEA